MTNKDSAPPPLLDANLLQLFELIYSTRSVTRAAEQLGLAQPTVSIWLGKLRKHLDDPLFVRTPSGMQPTPEADALIGTVRQALESLRALSQREARFDPATSDRRFRIGMTDASHITLLPQLLAHVRSVAPGVRLGAEQIDGQIGARLESGEADLALGFIPELGAGFYQQSLYTQDWVCLANGNHPRITETLTLADYQREEHIHIVSGTGHNLLESSLDFTSLTLMMQKEVAERLAAQPGSKAYGPLSIAVQTQMSVDLALEVGHASFMPKPKVDSAVVVLTPLEKPADVGDRKQFNRVVKLCFAQRRKTLANSLSSYLGLDKAVLPQLLSGCGLSPTARPEELTLDDFCRLADALAERE